MCIYTTWQLVNWWWVLVVNQPLNQQDSEEKRTHKIVWSVPGHEWTEHSISTNMIMSSWCEVDKDTNIVHTFKLRLLHINWHLHCNYLWEIGITDVQTHTDTNQVLYMLIIQCMCTLHEDWQNAMPAYRNTCIDIPVCTWLDSNITIKKYYATTLPPPVLLLTFHIILPRIMRIRYICRDSATVVIVPTVSCIANQNSALSLA